MNADELSRVALSSNLASALARAKDNARTQGHREVTLEHMLVALSEDPDAGLVLAASNVDVMKLRSDAARYLAGLERQAFSGRAAEPAMADNLRRILDAAAAAARGGRRREINGAIVLAAIVGDGKSPAAQMLQSQGLTFEGAIRALQRGAGVARAFTSTEDILASARERVQSRSVPVGMRTETTAPPEQDEEYYEEADPEPAPEPAPAPVPDYDDVPPTVDPHRPEPYRQEPPRAAPPVRAPDVDIPPAPEPAPPPPRPAPARMAQAIVRKAPPPPAPVPSMPADEQMAAPLQDFEHDYPITAAPSVAAAPISQAPPPQLQPAPPPLPGAAPAPPWTPPPANSLEDAMLAIRSGGPPLPAQAAPAPQPPSSPRLSELGEPRRPPGVGAGSDFGDSDVYASLTRGQRNLQDTPPSEMRSVARAPTPRAEIGQLVENIPRTMRVAVPVLIEVRIARAEVQSLAEGLQGGGAAYRHEVTVTKAMSVRLRAPDGGFYIETASPETQWIERSALISSDEYASWRWHVTPREKGRRRLQLIISARTVSTDGLAAETALPDQVISVRVRTNYGRSASRLLGWSIAAVAGGLVAKFGEGALDHVVQIVTRLVKG